MAVDVLVLNTAVVDFRRPDFEFADELVGQGGLAKCKPEQMPHFSQDQLTAWIRQGCATAGGPGNTAPLISRGGLKVAVGVNLGKGDCHGLDAQGRFFYDVMLANGVDMSATFVHPHLPTGTTYIHQTSGNERGGIAYFPGANDDFDFRVFQKAVERLGPKIIYYMYSGLSERGDANQGRDLAEFMKWCGDRQIVTVADSSTLTPNPDELIRSGRPVPQYRLLEPLLPELDVFFTSSDEARLIANTLMAPPASRPAGQKDEDVRFLDALGERFWLKGGRTKLLGVTVSRGAYEKHMNPAGLISGVTKIESRFMAGDIVDLVGAGDAFRAGLITYIGHNLVEFNKGAMDFAEDVQMGNLFAALYIKAPLDDRHGHIQSYDKMLKVVRSGDTYPSFNALRDALG